MLKLDDVPERASQWFKFAAVNDEIAGELTHVSMSVKPDFDGKLQQRVWRLDILADGEDGSLTIEPIVEKDIAIEGSGSNILAQRIADAARAAGLPGLDVGQRIRVKRVENIGQAYNYEAEMWAANVPAPAPTEPVAAATVLPSGAGS